MGRSGVSVVGRAAWCALALLVLAGAAACSGDDSGDDGGSPGAPTSAAADPTSTTAAPPGTDAGAEASPDENGGAVDPRSEVRSVEVAETADHGEFEGVAYVRVTGSIQGVVGPDEAVAGLDGLAMDDEGLYPYSASFEVIRPADPTPGTVLVEAENRGNGLLRLLLGEPFLHGGGRAYARVAWQTEINPDVPADAQGVGQVIVRDFGRLLRDGQVGGADSPLGRFEHRVLAGWSQGAWFATTLLAEGFNVDPGEEAGVFDGVIALSGAGNVLAINSFGDDGLPQQPYVRPDAAPLPAGEVLTRPESDPVYVDIANYTDFYRLRAGLTAGGDVEGYRRYDWPSAHAPGSLVPPEVVFGSYGCNGGTPVMLNPLDFSPYLRAVLVGLEGEIGAPVPDAQRSAAGQGLPPTAEFDLTDQQPAGTGDLNPLPGVTTPVPAADDRLQPLGGVRFPELSAPLGMASPVSLPPVTTSGIEDVCGNFGGWLPTAPADVVAQWPTADDYLAAYDTALTELIESGYVLPMDRDLVLTRARSTFDAIIEE